jgi:spartin
VNGWTHPLIPGVSPVLEAGNGAFMFPDDYSGHPGSSIGIVITDDNVYNVDGEAHALLAQLLIELTALQREVPLSEDQRLGKIGKTLVKGAELVTKGLGYGAEKASQLIEYVGEKEKQKAIARGVPPSEVKLSPALKTTLKGTKFVTNSTVRVSGFVANRVGKLTKGLADHLANKMEKPVTGAVVGATGGRQNKSSSMHNLVDAARGGLLAYGTVYAGLESSAKVLGKSVKDNTVKVVEVKYGQEAKQATDDGISAAGDAAMTYLNIQSLGVKGLVKRTAKDTGKSLGKKVLDAHTPTLPPDEKAPL